MRGRQGEGGHEGGGGGLAVQGVRGLPVRGVTGPVAAAGGTGLQPALPRCAGPWGCCPGDKMIDWVSPPAGMRPLSLIRPSAWSCAAEPVSGLTADWRELAAVVPIG